MGLGSKEIVDGTLESMPISCSIIGSVLKPLSYKRTVETQGHLHLISQCNRVKTRHGHIMISAYSTHSTKLDMFISIVIVC